jgi:uncharacterized protein YkwD
MISHAVTWPQARKTFGALAGALLLLAAPLQAAPGFAADEDQVAASITVDTGDIAAALSLTPLEQSLLDATNADRAANGVPPVVMDPLLIDVARARAAAQLTLPALDHTDGHGHLVFAGLLQGAGVSYSLAGENLARTYGAGNPGLTPAVEGALMRSPLHRKNILQPEFSRMAVGVALDDSGRVVFAEIFRALP